MHVLGASSIILTNILVLVWVTVELICVGLTQAVCVLMGITIVLFQGVKITVRVQKGQAKGTCQVRNASLLCVCAYVCFVCLHVRHSCS